MYLRLKFFLLLFFIVLSSQAQDFSISGKLIDSQTKAPLEAATVFAETVKDSSLITYTITDKSGDFALKSKFGQDKLSLYVSFIGYESYSKTIDLTQGRDIVLGEIPLQVQIETLGDVIVNARSAPVTIKKDTLEFNVASFKTKKDATVEDLLRELPGVEVDEQGQITVNGKQVNQILVNGKPFFGDDPTIATRNLTKEIIEKIQVTDTKTKSEAFTGEQGDTENKTINITIDEEKNKGIFGRVAAGGGTDDRFEYAGLVNFFDNDLRISALGGGNNINSPGFSFGEIEKMFGSARYVSINDNGNFNINGRNFGGGQGINNSRTAGLNYADNLGKNTEAGADYFYSASNSFEEEKRERENILPEYSYFTTANSKTDTNNDNHAVNASFETKRDSTWFLEIRPKFNYTEGVSRFERQEETQNADRELSNSSDVKRSTLRNGRNFENNLTVTHKYGVDGAFLRLRVNNDINNTTSDILLNSLTEIYGDDPETIDRNQYTVGKQSVMGYDLNASWRLPLISKKLFLNIEYQFNNERREDEQFVYDYNNILESFEDFNLVQSTDFTNKNRSSRPEVGLNYREDDMNLSFNAGYVMRTLKSDDALRDIYFENDFDALELNANIWKKISEKASFWGGYNLRNSAPGVRQLSPYIDVSDPLNTIQGNPNLEPENSHSINLGLNNFDWQSRTGFNLYGSASFSNKSVVSKSTIDENYIRNTTYANVDGNYYIYGSASYGKNIELDTLRTLKYDLSFRVNANRNVNFNNAIQYASQTTTYTPTVGLRFTWKGLFEIRPEYNISFSRNTFDLDLFENREYLQQQLRVRTTTTFPKKLEWNNDVRYIYNPDVAVGFQKSSVFWNSSLAYSVLQDKGLLTLKVYDLLNQNTNAQRTATSDYIQDVQSTVLQRYFMLSFSYKFNSLGKKGEIRENNWFD